MYFSFPVSDESQILKSVHTFQVTRHERKAKKTEWPKSTLTRGVQHRRGMPFLLGAEQKPHPKLQDLTLTSRHCGSVAVCLEAKLFTLVTKRTHTHAPVSSASRFLLSASCQSTTKCHHLPGQQPGLIKTTPSNYLYSAHTTPLTLMTTPFWVRPAIRLFVVADCITSSWLLLATSSQ